jgi:hypothetical protein
MGRRVGVREFCVRDGGWDGGRMRSRSGGAGRGGEGTGGERRGFQVAKRRRGCRGEKGGGGTYVAFQLAFSEASLTPTTLSAWRIFCSFSRTREAVCEPTGLAKATSAYTGKTGRILP